MAYLLVVVVALSTFGTQPPPQVIQAYAVNKDLCDAARAAMVRDLESGLTVKSSGCYLIGIERGKP